METNGLGGQVTDRYEERGNLDQKVTNEGTTTYTYDTDNRLVMVNLSGGYNEF